jgi:hypothetical protein
MIRSQRVAVACHLKRSSFSGERIFRVGTAAGAEYVGAAPVQHCRLSGGEPLAADQPPEDREIAGLVDALLVENGGKLASVALPDGEVIEVDQAQVRLPRSEELRYVPL